MNTDFACDASQINQHLSQVALLSPKVLIVRTDMRFGGHQGIHTATLAKATRKISFDLGPSCASRSIKQIEIFLGATPQDASEVYAHIEALTRANRSGSWCLHPDETAPRVERLDHPFLAQRVASLRARLPLIESIDTQILLQPTHGGHLRRRVFVQLQDAEQRQRLAIDTAYIATHIASLVVQSDDNVRANIARCQIWAEQMGVELSELPEIMHDLHGLFVQCGIGHLSLRSGSPD